MNIPCSKNVMAGKNRVGRIAFGRNDRNSVALVRGEYIANTLDTLGFYSQNQKFHGFASVSHNATLDVVLLVKFTCRNY